MAAGHPWRLRDRTSGKIRRPSHHDGRWVVPHPERLRRRPVSIGSTRKTGAASYSVGMPSFAPIYALHAAMKFLHGIGIAAIAAHADPLVREVHKGLVAREIVPLTSLRLRNRRFQTSGERTHRGGAAAAKTVHIMHQGRAVCASRCMAKQHAGGCRPVLTILDTVLRRV